MFLQARLLVKYLVRADISTEFTGNILRTSVAHAHRIKYDMEKVYLRNTADSKDLHISFHYRNPSCNLDRNFNFCRNINEKVSDTMTRIRFNIEKELNKKLRKAKLKGKAAADPPVELFNTEELTVQVFRKGCDDSITDVSFAEILAVNRKDLQLKVLDQTFEIVVNSPWVLNLVLPTTILAGFKVYPKLDLQFGERSFSRAKWYRAEKPKSGDLEKGAAWVECGDGFFYNSSSEDVGFYLKFAFTPGNSSGDFGPTMENITKNEVQAGPGFCPFETRHCFTSDRLSGDAFRVVTYNLLADLYADSDYSRKELFPYCAPYALKMDYRKQLFLREIEGYNADILCLQEVDMKIFDHDLKAVLETETLNYSGLIEQKGSSGEGIATFYRNDRFDLIKTCGINIGDNIKKLPEFGDVWEKMATNKKLTDRICERSTTLQLTVLKCRENGQHLLVVNTHLYFHPDSDNVRLLQIGFAMRYVEHMVRSMKEELKLQKEEDIALVFCGDFNSVPECGIYKLMTEKFVGSDFIDWSSNEEEDIGGVSLSQPFSMKSACGTPLYTNYTHLFAACLDYIFYNTESLEVQQVIPLPTVEELKLHTAIPSVVFPSDHIALVADLTFKPK